MADLREEPNVRCSSCGTAIKRKLADKSEHWDYVEGEGWLCPHCNPNSDKSW